MSNYEKKDKSVQEIAQDLERDRAALGVQLESLRERLSVDALMGDALSYIKHNTAPLTRGIDHAVRANPAAAVMVGAGLAWLVFGRKSRATPKPVLGGTQFEALSRWADEGGPPMEADDAWIAQADGLRDRASAALARIDAEARDKLRPVTEIAQERAAVLASLAQETQAAMRSGLETLGAAAQQRILALREAAYSARGTAMRQGVDWMDAHPLVAGAMAAAIGAAVAAALPRTETEDRLFGAERDRLLATARDVLNEERARAQAAAGHLRDTVASEVQETARKVVADAL